ncbi:alpha/beta fold hydrolase [Pseudonocardia sp. H11422]|uniref:alpha/beta fold hydrolase n=1 Tax=Pseudonocardia sp. H11422 TaxID=2835866 RepID=UPI001BDC0470|nr:alpha/beta hydrolase [Pseudonocardia sp. H11422]
MPEPTRGFADGPAGALSYLSWAGPPGVTPILFLHPVNTAAAIWTDVAGILSQHRPAIAVDYRGHGGSAAGGPYSPADYAADALAVLDHLLVPSAHVVSGSIGGAVAVELAAANAERVASILPFGATLRIGLAAAELATMAVDMRAVGVEAWFSEHASGILGPASRPDAAARLVQLAGGRDVDVVVEITEATFGAADSRAAARIIAASPPPSQVYVGTDDPTCPPEMARELADHLRATVRSIPDIGHLPMLEDPVGTAREVRLFLDGLDHGHRTTPTRSTLPG